MTDEERDILLLAAVRYCQGRRGKRVREQAGVSQQEMARRVGVHETALWRWENGKRRPRDEFAVKWALQLMMLDPSSKTANVA